ncbi:MAG: SRPBCC family protein [Asgard group archaeon]|nr:SRPBCC family protein [Asgard group archaeon]
MIKEHVFSIELDHSTERIWALMQDYDLWKQFTQAIVIDIEILYPGDKNGNGLIRRVHYKLPWGSRCSIELVTNVKPNVGYTYTMLSLKPGLDTNGLIRLEKLAVEKTRIHFEERFNLKKLPLLYRMLGNKLYKLINKRNEETFRNLSKWLDDHPDYMKNK